MRKKGGSKLAAEASKVPGATMEKKKLRMPQEEIDYILSWDVDSDYVFRSPDNLDDMPISDAAKQRYRANRQEAVAVMREGRRLKKEFQEWVKSELQKHGYIEVEATDEMLAELQLEDHKNSDAA